MRIMQHNTIEIGKKLTKVEAGTPKIISMLDIQGRFLYISSAMRETFGINEEALAGKCISKVGLADRQTGGILLSLLRLAALEGKSTSCELECNTVDGKKDFLIRFEPVKNEYGITASIVAIATDISNIDIKNNAAEEYGMDIKRAIEAAGWDSVALASLLPNLFERLKYSYLELIGSIENGNMSNAKKLTRHIWKNSKNFGIGYVAVKATQMEQAIRDGVRGHMEECIITLGIAISYFEMELARLCVKRA